jgi:hypothetical protein
MAITHEQYNDPAEDIFLSSFRYEQTGGGQNEIVFQDPFAGGESLDQNKLPSSIAVQDRYINGLNILQNFGESGHHVTVAGAPHGDGARFNNGQMRQLLAGHDVIFLEG